MTAASIVDRVRRAAGQRLLFLPRAIRQMARPERMITTSEVRSVFLEGAVIEIIQKTNEATAA